MGETFRRGETFPDVLSPRERLACVWFVNMGGQGKGEKELSKRILPSWRFFNSFDSPPKDIPRIFYPLSTARGFQTPSWSWKFYFNFSEIKFQVSITIK